MQDILDRLLSKVEVQHDRIGDIVPYISCGGRYPEDYSAKNPYWWTNGFWAGMLWQMYNATGKYKFIRTAVRIEEKLEPVLSCSGKLDHDIGFLWSPTAVAHYRVTGDESAHTRAENAAVILAGRYNPAGEYIRAWNGEANEGSLIIDSMMNLPLLYWMSEESGDPRFAAVAVRHADTTAKLLVRDDGSCRHIAMLDPENGELRAYPAGAAYSPESAWSRGHAWAIYGFALSFRHTKELRFLNTAKKIAHYFIANITRSGYVPLCDFRAPKEPARYDTSAGACAACGLLMIAEQVNCLERDLYIYPARSILKELSRHYVNWTDTEDGLLQMGRVSYGTGRGYDNLIYGDYYFLEAMLMLFHRELFIW